MSGEPVDPPGAGGTRVEGRRPRVEMESVSKSFGSLKALDDVTFGLDTGQIHALVGENGAGKSTLMRVLAGHMDADSGRLVIDGRSIDAAHPSDGSRPEIGFVEQEGGLVPELTGVENYLLAASSQAVIDRRRAAKTIEELAQRFGGDINPNVPVQALAVGQRQRLEILIVMARGAEVLILDEPTAALGSEEAAVLKQIVRQFAADGGSVVYISHKLNEVVEISDEITVMRRGKVVGRHQAGNVSVEQLAVEMVGRQGGSAGAIDEDELLDVALGTRAAVSRADGQATVCSLSGLQAKAPFVGESSLQDVSFDVHAGEIVGVAGVVGSGQTTLAGVLAGFIKPERGLLTRPDNVAYIPENRHKDAIALTLSLEDNMILRSHRNPEFARAGYWFNGLKVKTHVDGILTRSNVVFSDVMLPIRALSGGNQQKAVVAREMERGPSLVVAHNPFRGLDVRAISEVRDAMLSAAEGGAGVVMISPDIDELRQMSDRIVVMFAGTVIGEVSPDDDVERLGRLIGGLQ